MTKRAADMKNRNETHLQNTCLCTPLQ